MNVRAHNPSPHVWAVHRARQWCADQPFLIGCNFTPSTASNQIEFWRAESFDLSTIDRELGWAARIGLNSTRTYLHDAVWRADAQGFKDRIRRYLDAADAHGVATMFCIFDDCWQDDIDIRGRYDPIPGKHNSRWLQSPGHAVVRDPSQWAPLEDYLKDILSAFADDERVIVWDLYNEPGNGSIVNEEGEDTKNGKLSLPFLQAVFRWAREVNPPQPLTAGVWNRSEPFSELNAFQLAESDITSFHCYGDLGTLREWIAWARQGKRPLICTEWLARGMGSRFGTHLPVFIEEEIGCYNWGLVAGRTQTYQPWGSREGDSEADPWHHDLLRSDGSPYDPAEVDAIRAARAKHSR